MKRNNAERTLTGYELSGMVLPESDDRFDQELVGWFALHLGDWSGTAAELLAAVKTRVDVSNDLWPQSASALYAYMESHKQIFRSLGVAILLPDGYPRVISLRSCQEEKPAEILLSDPSGVNLTSEPQINLSAFAYDQQNEFPNFDQVSAATDVTFGQYIAAAQSHVTTERSVNGIHAGADDFEGSIFENPGEAFCDILEMRLRIEEQGLDLKSAIDLVVGRTQEITQSDGVAVGLIQQQSVVYPARAGVAAVMGELHFQENLFQSCRKTRQALQLSDAQKHRRVGPGCRQEGIASLIIVPIFHKREVAGGIELLFKERRSFSASDVTDLELIADVISESLGGIEPMEMKPAEQWEYPAETKAGENIESRLGDSLNDAVTSPSAPPTDAQTSLTTSATPEIVLGLLASKLATAPTLLWLTFKRAWIKCGRVLGIPSSGSL